jgi:hypothetical protein
MAARGSLEESESRWRYLGMATGGSQDGRASRTSIEEERGKGTRRECGNIVGKGGEYLDLKIVTLNYYPFLRLFPFPPSGQLTGIMGDHRVTGINHDYRDG